MGKIVPLEGPSLAWARGVFASYYGRTPVEPPSRFARREFAAFPFATESLMRRHASFRSAEEFQRYLAHEAPRHVYYSSAYYRNPDHLQMAAKEWLGADLIFDLDADHLRGADRLDYAGQLALAKERVIDLFDDFLLGDFGVPPSAAQLVFSGGRGYHIHVTDERFLPLSSPERRELVDYVMGLGFDPTTAVLHPREDEATPVALAPSDAGAVRSGSGPRPRAYLRLVPPETPGWRGRTTRSMQSVLARWEAGGVGVATEELVGMGLTPRAARALARSLVEDGKATAIRTKLSLDVFPREVPPALLQSVLASAAVEVQGETDAPVTTDIHRLIRLPNSLHGGTGFRVRPLTRSSIEGFLPLRDALPELPSAPTVAVELLESVDVPFEPDPVRGAAGDRRELPTPLALFLVLRGAARLPS